MYTNIKEAMDNILKAPIKMEHDFNDKSFVALGDSLDLMDNIKDDSIDLIFADEPYNIKKDFDGIKDYKEKNDYINWNHQWIENAMRVLKPDGTLYLMTSTQYMPYIDIFLSENYNVISRIVWTYDSSGVQSKKRYGSLYEPIIMATKSKKSKYTFNYEDIMVEAKTGSKRKLIDYRKNPPRPYNVKKVPGNVWNFNRVRYLMEEYENHPTQKPEALMERIIKASSNPGDIVLDPFGGSFTTSKVAQNLDRLSISSDLNEKYYEIALRRLGITDERNGKILVKDKIRKTNNLSKKVREKETNKNQKKDKKNSPSQMDLF